MFYGFFDMFKQNVVTKAGDEQKFSRLNTFQGKTKEEIIQIVGQPNSITELPDGRQLVQWVFAGLPLTVVFDSKGMYQGIDAASPKQTRVTDT
jgi:hypothetical protein